MSAPYPLTLETPRLILHLADPTNEEDCNRIIQIYNDPYASRGGNARVGINTIADVRAKDAAYRPRKELCTKIDCEMDRMYHLAYLKDSNGQQSDLIGFVGMSFRPEVQYPDLGYALLGP
ncbi:hypothetical protein Slin15195_G077970 [Septoria linicola]|uniref:Uncharacterized protein n=1 Tax=Septoria linicola TaxID=215465 RepID=A0A9Q9AYP5_9PEZI|nr:hypothetical protein Slin14017_G039150 [Septoria linicola]USW54478.1 hypothetical protein Slin15195_G077970 [Septoria linicola]